MNNEIVVAIISAVSGALSRGCSDVKLFSESK